MNEFLNVLKLNLMDRLTPAELNEQVALYENYINEQLAGGKTLEQVMRKLGDPEKVADMIVKHYGGQESEKTEQTNRAGRIFRDMTTDEINEQIQNPDRGIHAEFKENEGWDVRLGKLKLNTWYGTLIILGIVLVVFVLFSELLRK
ncbi:MAG: DUF1700 domain-containing protein [Lachnospiraceae bacterium]|nr:DUF1700 domain-containing protein [Lachnospiraceae bacterium]